jgi:hypothetical protein
MGRQSLFKTILDAALAADADVVRVVLSTPSFDINRKVLYLISQFLPF